MVECTRMEECGFADRWTFDEILSDILFWDRSTFAAHSNVRWNSLRVNLNILSCTNSKQWLSMAMYKELINIPLASDLVTSCFLHVLHLVTEQGHARATYFILMYWLYIYFHFLCAWITNCRRSEYDTLFIINSHWSWF